MPPHLILMILMAHHSTFPKASQSSQNVVPPHHKLSTKTGGSLSTSRPASRARACWPCCRVPFGCHGASVGCTVGRCKTGRKLTRTCLALQILQARFRTFPSAFTTSPANSIPNLRKPSTLALDHKTHHNALNSTAPSPPRKEDGSKGPPLTST